VAVLVLLLLGGVTYTAGAVCYALRWPTGWPRVFVHHEFFHAATLLAALAHHIAIYLALRLAASPCTPSRLALYA